MKFAGCCPTSSAVTSGGMSGSCEGSIHIELYTSACLRLDSACLRPPCADAWGGGARPHTARRPFGQHARPARPAAARAAAPAQPGARMQAAAAGAAAAGGPRGGWRGVAWRARTRAHTAAQASRKTHLRRCVGGLQPGFEVEVEIIVVRHGRCLSRSGRRCLLLSGGAGGGAPLAHAAAARARRARGGWRAPLALRVCR